METTPTAPVTMPAMRSPRPRGAGSVAATSATVGAGVLVVPVVAGAGWLGGSVGGDAGVVADCASGVGAGPVGGEDAADASAGAGTMGGPEGCAGGAIVGSSAGGAVLPAAASSICFCRLLIFSSISARCAIVKAPTKLRRHNLILLTYEHGDWTVVVAQVIFRGETVHEHQMHRQQQHVRLGNVGQPVVRREQNHACNLVRVLSGQIRGDTGAE